MSFHGTGPLPILIGGWTLTGIAAGVIIARLYLRIKIQSRRLLLSDIFMVAAWFCGCACNSISIVLMRLGALDPSVGTDLKGFTGNPDNISKILKVFWLGLIPVHLTYYLCKGALLLLYLQIFPHFMRKRRILLWATIVYNFLAFVASNLVVYCICHPIQTFWDGIPSTSCSSKGVIIFMVTWSLNTTGEISVFLLPWLILPGLNIRRSLKIGVYGTFFLGVVTIVFGILRFVSILNAHQGTSVPLSTPVLWNTLECNLGLVIACMPSLRPYFNSNDSSKGKPITPEKPLALLTTDNRWTADSMAMTSVSSNRPDQNIWDEDRTDNNSKVDLMQVRPIEDVV
ncbi:hypothetical protein BGZ61DRAFT_593220 [Ilyonectria robusta]|uniref:uncharacterized protein n=1 Tax=Ilyonectria robusta TaxID=1079257 RepID=UPI001E8E7408|nr:uncharacterized protein BGZ61DRAFT_593220 [Ilyonectria robusta]KAH8664853.1 hypothetical protein BGZ61DRAFT_593220 [Ilyonectria robusta]